VAGAGAQPKTVPVPGRKRLRKKLAREDDSPPAIGDQQVLSLYIHLSMSVKI
jgi:hypothetical protein